MEPYQSHSHSQIRLHQNEVTTLAVDGWIPNVYSHFLENEPGYQATPQALGLDVEMVHVATTQA